MLAWSHITALVTLGCMPPHQSGTWLPPGSHMVTLTAQGTPGDSYPGQNVQTVFALILSCHTSCNQEHCLWHCTSMTEVVTAFSYR